MGYIRNAFAKLFCDNSEPQNNQNKVSTKKVLAILFGLNVIIVAQIAGERQEAHTGNKNYKISTQLVNAFNDKEANLTFSEDKACKDKYVTTTVTNIGSRIAAPKHLSSEDCNINRPLYSNKAKEQFYNLKNKSHFRIKYMNQGDFQKIIDVQDAGLDGLQTISATFSSIDIRNNCITANNQKYCGLPNIHRGIYQISFLANQDKEIIEIYYINKL